MDHRVCKRVDGWKIFMRWNIKTPQTRSCQQSLTASNLCDKRATGCVRSRSLILIFLGEFKFRIDDTRGDSGASGIGDFKSLLTVAGVRNL
jgi:hypothetical protein